MITVTILLTSDAAEDNGEGIRRLPEIEELKKSGAVLSQNDPDSEDDELRRYYSVELQNEQEAQVLIDKLMKTDAVEAAFITPKGEPPG